MRFRPCIDLHQGIVKQIVGGTLTDRENAPATNFTSQKTSAFFAAMYRQDQLWDGHVIQLGAGNETAAKQALAAWPGGLQIGGGITCDNAREWIESGASAVIVTSHIFHDGKVDHQRLNQLVKTIGKKRLVLDLSCRKKEEDYFIVTNRWQTFTDEKISLALLDELAASCNEFLIHAVDVEGKCQGIELPLIALLGKWGGIPVTYAGGIHSYEDIEQIKALGHGRIDYTVGSALDIFGGRQLSYAKIVKGYHDPFNCCIKSMSEIGREKIWCRRGDSNSHEHTSTSP